jgi:hypothetical protein
MKYFFKEYALTFIFTIFTYWLFSLLEMKNLALTSIFVVFSCHYSYKQLIKQGVKQINENAFDLISKHKSLMLSRVIGFTIAAAILSLFSSVDLPDNEKNFQHLILVLVFSIVIIHQSYFVFTYFLKDKGFIDSLIYASKCLFCNLNINFSIILAVVGCLWYLPDFITYPLSCFIVFEAFTSNFLKEED